MKCSKFFKKVLLSILVFALTITQLTPNTTVHAIEEVKTEESEPYILGENETLREESSKTFILSDHTKQKVIYSIPVHYEDDGEWKEIDNRLIDDGLVYVNHIETDDTDDPQVIGYKNKDGNFDIKFSKKVHKNNMVSISDGDYKITGEKNRPCFF